MIRLRTLGRLTIEREDGGDSASILAQPKKLALLVYMAAMPAPADISRDTLVALLWPELDEHHARTALRQGLHQLRRSLDPGIVKSTGAERVGVNRGRVWCDAAAFKTALEDRDPESALGLYDGPFLEGFHLSEAPEFERWVDRERHRLEAEAVAAAWHLANDAEARQDRAGGRRWARRAIELSPYDEAGFRRYLDLLVRQSDPAAAISAFNGWAQRLAQDLELQPSTETVTRIERIRAEASSEHGSPPPLAAAGEPLDAGGTVHPAQPSMPPVAPGPARAIEAPAARKARWPWLAGVALLTVLGFTVWGMRSSARDVHANPSSRLAVLPFRLLGPDTAQAYLAEGLHDALLNQLSQVASLQVVGPTSVDRYRDTPPPVRRIAKELGVGHIVQGSVEIVGNRLRVVASLVDTKTMNVVPIGQFDRTVDDVFAVQSDIAERIVAAVGATLTSTEQRAIVAVPSRDAAAYRLYLQGLDYARRPELRAEDALAARELFGRAVALDSTFAPAHAELALIDWRSYDLGWDRTTARRNAGLREAGIALRLAPGMPRAHLAYGLTRFLGDGDFRGAIDEFKAGLRAAPNDAELWAWVGRTDRHLGMWDSAFAALDHAARLEPRDATLFFSMAEAHHYLHQYAEAIRAYRQALALAPAFRQAHMGLAWSRFLWTGHLDTLRALVRDMPDTADPGAGGASALSTRLVLLLWDRKPDSLLATLRRPEVRAAIEPISRLEFVGRAECMLGDTAAVEVAFDSVRVMLDSALLASPNDWTLHARRGAALAALGMRREALQEADWLARSKPYREDRYRDGWVIGSRSELLAEAGDIDAALPEIERSLALPSGRTVYMLRVEPGFDSIRNNPQFQALLAKYADPEAR